MTYGRVTDETTFLINISIEAAIYGFQRECFEKIKRLMR
jgi:hypothetical protein